MGRRCDQVARRGLRITIIINLGHIQPPLFGLRVSQRVPNKRMDYTGRWIGSERRFAIAASSWTASGQVVSSRLKATAMSTVSVPSGGALGSMST